MPKTIQIGSQLLTAILIAPVGGAATGSAPPIIDRSIGGTIAEYRYSDAGDIYRSDISISTISAVHIIENVDRPTTEREKLIGEMRGWKTLKANWDGEGAEAPDSASIEEAVAFVNALNEMELLPDVMLHSSGRAGLYWNTEGLYADIEFTGEGRLTYYVEHPGNEKHKGGIGYSKGNIPRFSPFFSKLKQPLDLLRRGVLCRCLHHRTYEQKDRVQTISSIVPECQCERHRMSRHSPGSGSQRDALSFRLLPDPYQQKKRQSKTILILPYGQ